MPSTSAQPAAVDPARRSILGWCMYDWANSAYTTTTVAGLLPVFFADAIVGPNGAVIGGTTYSATTLWAFAVSAASLLVFLTAPVLGAVADFSASKKKFLLACAWTGSFFALLVAFCGPGDVLSTLVLFVIAQFGFVGGNVFYDAFLPQIVDETRMDRVSGRGYAFGYVGGGLQFAVSLGLIAGHDSLGLSLGTAARIGMIMAALWWAGFTICTALWLREPAAAQPLPARYREWSRPLAYAAVGLGRTFRTARQVSRFRHLALFLLAFMLYNDGIQTVIDMASIYGKEELGLSVTALMVTLLVVQVVATAGSLLFSRLAERLGTKRAVMLTLVLWSGVVIYAYYITSAAQFFLLGGVVGLVLGGSQALSRSLYGSMVPTEASAEFFGFYTVFSKFSAIWGPLAFGVIRHYTGSARSAIVSLIVFFLLGLILLAFVNEDRARAARFEGAI